MLCPYDYMSMKLADMETVSVRPRSQLLRLSIERSAAIELGSRTVGHSGYGLLGYSFGAQFSLREFIRFPYNKVGRKFQKDTK